MEDEGKAWANGNAAGRKAAKAAITRTQEDPDTLAALVREIGRHAARIDDAHSVGFMFTIAASCIGAEIVSLL